MEIQEKYVQELITTGMGTEGQLLIPRKIHDTLIAEVDKKLLPRTLAAFYVGPGMIPGSSYDIDLETENIMSVRIVAEGTEVWLDQDEYESTNVKPVKYGIAIKITKEMEEDSKWPLLQRNVSKAGKRFAENETSLIITQLDNATNTITGGAAITLANISRGIQYLDDADYEGDAILVGNEVANDMRGIDTLTEVNKYGSAEMLKQGMINIVYGLPVYRFSTNAAPSSTYAKYAYIIDTSEAYAIVEKRPVTVENFTLPTYDMSGASVTQRIAIKYLRANAIAKITTS